MSTLENCTQFVVHVKSEYDYMFESDFRQQIFDALKWTYHQHYGKNLPIYGIPFKLKEYQTSKKDISEGHEFTPPNDFRLKDEDIYEEE